MVVSVYQGDLTGTPCQAGSDVGYIRLDGDCMGERKEKKRKKEGDNSNTKNVPVLCR